MTRINKDTPIGAIVRENFERARIFESYGIDFCCGGEVTIGEACASGKLDPGALIEELEAHGPSADRSSRYIETPPPPALSDYIVDTHHTHVRDQIPYIGEKLNKLCEVHGPHHPELFEVREMFHAASENLLAHMKKEEEVLFPAITRLATLGSYRENSPWSVEQVTRPIHELKEEHKAEGDRFREMDRMTGHFQVPPDGCNTFHVTYRSLQEFISDLHRHIHLENNILFPETEKLEQKLLHSS